MSLSGSKKSRNHDKDQERQGGASGGGGEVIDSDEEAFDPRPDAGYESDPDEIKESAEEKRLRLAKTYLEEIEKEGKSNPSFGLLVSLSRRFTQLFLSCLQNKPERKTRPVSTML